MSEGRLPPWGLVLAVEQAIAEGGSLAATQERLWRECPDEVARVWHRLRIARAERLAEGRRAEHARGKRALRRPRKSLGERGVTLAEMAKAAGVPRAVLVKALEYAGILSLVPCGRGTRRYLPTKVAEDEGLGHMVDPGATHSPRTSGRKRAAPFAAFRASAVPTILERLGLDRIRAAIAEQAGKRQRVAWAVTHAGHLPSAFLASLCGCTTRGIEKARSRLGASESSVACYNSEAKSIHWNI